MVEGARVGIDVGGTFTDLVAVRDGELVSAKVRSTPQDQSLGVMAALEASGLEPSEVAAIAHGTTVSTNALLERRGARTALVTTARFRDVIEIGRQNRPALYDLTTSPPEPLVPRELRFTVSERVGPQGVLLALDGESVRRAVEEIAAAQVEAVAVCLLFSFVHPDHEHAIREALREALPDVHVSLSSEVLPEFREYERFATTTADAYLAPGLAAYLLRLGKRLGDAGLPEPVVMQSSGGVTGLETAAGLASSCVLSGPAAGVVAAAFVAGESGFSDLLTFDMGGTSTDVSVVLGGEVQTTTGAVVAGIPIKHPLVDVHTVSAGGGSVAWIDSGGALRVGPRSAGAEPGPACYGNGGTEATVTDADLFLGYLRDGQTLGREVVLSRSLAEQALGELAAALGLDPVAAAAGVVVVAEAEMVRALRVITVERGIDPRDLTIVAFGGAGGMHACRLAEELRVARILFPRAGGVLSALGLAVSDLRRDYVAPLFGDPETLAAEDLEAAFAALERRARADLPEPAAVRRSADARFRGQSFELTIPVAELPALSGSFRDAHRARYGYELPDTPVELVAVRVAGTSAVPKPKLTRAARPGGSPAAMEQRPAHFDGEWLDTR
ncbi:MAG: hydantoinase/oxoprolinase family protein, partial [Gaiellaceae bacterium]